MTSPHMQLAQATAESATPTVAAASSAALSATPPAADAVGNPYGLESLWLQGDWIIKTVAVLLLLMSIASWYIIVSRAWRTWRLQRAARRMPGFWHGVNVGEGLDALGGQASNPFSRLVRDGLAAREHHAACTAELHGQLSLADWLATSLRVTLDETAARMQSGLAVLASVGATAPFIGLFGTVWGIYHALVGIGVSGAASIDKVAGPVGEALIMTAFGLLVAIPAVLGYNALVRSNKGVTGQLNRFAHDVHEWLITGSRLQREAR